MIEITSLPTLADNYAYVLRAGDRAAVIDPGEAAPVSRFLARHQLKLTHVLLTHHHQDHVGGAAELKAEFDAAVWAPALEIDRIAGVDRGVADGEGLEILNTPVEVIGTPGHTRGHVCFYLPHARAVFTGDTLFASGCGRLFEGTFTEMFDSLRRLDALPPSTAAYFGHEYTRDNLAFVASRATGDFAGAVDARRAELNGADLKTTPTTIAAEREYNPFLRARTVEDFTAWRSARDAWVSPR